MAAPKGNNFWELRSKHGRDKLFATPDLMWDAACDYFIWCRANPLMEAQVVKGKTIEEDEVHGEVVKTVKNYELVEVPRLRAFTIQGLCHYLDCNVGYFNDFETGLKTQIENIKSKVTGGIISVKDKENLKQLKDFSVIVTRIRETIYRQKFEGASAGFLKENIIARDLGLTDKKQHDHSFREQPLLPDE